jgi:uncharacterized protein (TIGR02246 family)
MTTHRLFGLATNLIVASLCFVASTSNADEASVRGLLTQYITAFNQHDAKAVAALWTEGGVHIDRVNDLKTEGREAIARDLEIVFEASPNAKLTGEVTSVRMIRPEVAAIEGNTVLSGSGVDPSRTSFSAIAVSEADGWKIDSIEELPIQSASSPRDALRELEWLVGKWQDESDDVVIQTTCNWSPNEAFLIRSYVATVGDAVDRQGTQVIAWDANRQEIRSWNFDTSGGFGEGTWTKSDDEWLVRSSQTSAEGNLSSGTYLIRRVDDNSMTVQLLGQESDGALLPNQDPIRVVRIVDGNEAPTSPTTENGDAK